MRLYTPGEKFVTLATIVRVTLECGINFAMLGGALWFFNNGHTVIGVLMGAGSAFGLALTIILAAMLVRQ